MRLTQLFLAGALVSLCALAADDKYPDRDRGTGGSGDVTDTTTPQEQEQMPGEDMDQYPDRGTGGSGTVTDSSRAREELPKADADVLKKLHQANQEEIQIAQIGLQQATREDVKEYAGMIERDHRAADEKVTKVASEHGVQLMAHEKQMEKGFQKETAKLKDAKQFDKEFLTKMSKEHDKVISYLSRQRDNVQGDVRELVDELLPKLQKHRHEAKQLLEDVKARRTAKVPGKAQGRRAPEPKP